MASYDVIIVGTRCAGAALALLLARAGHTVLAIDRAAFPSDTVSTHFLWPRTTAFLAKWGLLDRLAATGCPAWESAMPFSAPIFLPPRSPTGLRTVAAFDYTVRAAGLGDPASALPLYARIAQSPEDTTRFMDVLGGTLAFKAFFNPANLSRLMRT